MRKNQKPRTHYRYVFKIGNKIVHGGITQDLEQRESQHQQHGAGAKATSSKLQGKRLKKPLASGSRRRGIPDSHLEADAYQA